MKIRIQDSNKFLNVDVEDPYQIAEAEYFENNLKPLIQESINKDDLKCDGCRNSLKGKAWISVNHRPKSAGGFKETMKIEDKENVFHNVEYQLKDVWALFLFCYDTRTDCIKKWQKRRPK